MRAFIALLAGMLLLAAVGIGFAPSSERATALVTAREEALKQNEKLRAMTNEFITKAYPDDPLLYCWARTTDCAAQTQTWLAGVEDLRNQFRTVVLNEFPDLASRLDVAEFRLGRRIAEIRALYVEGRPQDRVKGYNTARDAASDAFVLYRALPAEPTFMMTDAVLVLHKAKRAIGIN